MCQCRYVILLVVWLITASSGDVVRDENICGPHNGRRLYLELGERGVLRADNVTPAKNVPRQNASQSYVGNSSHDQCSLELVTCPSCIISITFKSINLLHHCGDGGMTVDSPCRCDYVWISEPPYEDVSGTPFCGHYAPINYRSNTRTLSIVLLYSQSHKYAFTVEYTAERNRLLLKGSNAVSEMSKSINITSGGILTSPFFPSRYPRDLGMEYIISCPNELPSCRVRVLFSDFQLAAVSIIEFYDWNGQRLDVSSGSRFRPPIIVSTGPSLLIRFYANGGTGLGYKAFYSFLMAQHYDTHVHPITDCGGYVDNVGGTITMMDMVSEGVKTYDCVWLIRLPKNFLHMKTHMYLKVITFAEMAGTTELIIKQGPTSALMPLEILRHPVSQLQPPKLKEHVVPVTSGFHVSLRGSFGANSRLAIAYAAFSYMDCFTGSDFLCQNHRCISSLLNCDGFDHCGDNSDEPSTCLHDWDLGMQDRKWQLNKANYYFPKIDRYPDLKTATLVFVASSLGLILLISALIILLYRVGARARHQRELQSRLRTISELLDGGRIDDVSITDEPPVYEAPPNYDEVIKLGLEDEESTTGGRRKKDGRDSRSFPSSHDSCDHEQRVTLNLYENGSNDNGSSQPMPVFSESNKNSVPVPESPPPPYLTPPGTTARQFDYSYILNLPGPSESSQSRDDNAEATESSTCLTPIPIDRDNQTDIQMRRGWLRNSGSIFHSLPTSGISSPSSPPGRSISPSSSSDADGALGAYVRGSGHVVSSSCAPDPSQVPCPSNFHVSQPGNSSAASENTRVECVSDCVNALEQNASPALEEPEEEEDESKRNEGALIVVCSCEGACGCASSETGRTLFSENSSAARNKVKQLLGNSRLVDRNSPAEATLCGSCDRLDIPRKLSLTSHDSCFTKISIISPSGSHEELRDEFDVVSETTSILDPTTLPNTPRNLRYESARTTLTSARRSSSFELSSLYESIKRLDLFLANRGSVNAKKKSPTLGKKKGAKTFMFFGASKHQTYSRSEDALLTPTSNRRCSRGQMEQMRNWQSTDDTFVN